MSSDVELREAGAQADRLRLLDLLPRPGSCVEIGVWKGAFSRVILERRSPRRLCLVDPWQFRGEVPDRMYGGLVARGQADMDAMHDDVVGRFRGHPEVEVWRRTSEAFLAAITDCFDWIYIDGDHGREAVYRDLALAWHRVVPGGYLAGDDYLWQDPVGRFEVKAAVDRFASERDLPVTLLGDQFAIRRPA